MCQTLCSKIEKHEAQALSSKELGCRGERLWPNNPLSTRGGSKESWEYRGRHILNLDGFMQTQSHIPHSGGNETEANLPKFSQLVSDRLKPALTSPPSGRPCPSQKGPL